MKKLTATIILGMSVFTLNTEVNAQTEQETKTTINANENYIAKEINVQNVDIVEIFNPRPKPVPDPEPVQEPEPVEEPEPVKSQRQIPQEELNAAKSVAQPTGSPKLYTLDQFWSLGVVYYNNYKFTYYSQRVLPGGGLRIPGRHVNKDGYVADENGYIVLAGSAPMGTIYDTPFGYKGKIYDRGTTGNHLDVYVR